MSLLLPFCAALSIVPWDVEVIVGVGVDGNALRNHNAQVQGALLHFGSTANLRTQKGLTLSLSGLLEQSLPGPSTVPIDARFTEADLEAVLFYQKPLLIGPKGTRLELRLGTLSEYGRTRTLFVESLAQQELVVLNQLGQHLLLGLRGRLGIVDLEGGIQGNYKWTDGVASYHAPGMRGYLAGRFFIGSGFSLRPRYEYQLRYLSGLTLPSAHTDVHLHINRVGLSMHMQRWFFESNALYDYARVVDDRDGSFDGDEHRGQLSLQVEVLDLLRLEAQGRFNYRSYPMRRPEQNLQLSDLQTGATFESRLLVYRRTLAVFLRYDFSHVEAPPTAQLIPRHLALTGLIWQAQGSGR